MGGRERGTGDERPQSLYCESSVKFEVEKALAEAESEDRGERILRHEPIKLTTAQGSARVPGEVNKTLRERA